MDQQCTLAPSPVTRPEQTEDDPHTRYLPGRRTRRPAGSIITSPFGKYIFSHSLAERRQAKTTSADPGHEWHECRWLWCNPVHRRRSSCHNVPKESCQNRSPGFSEPISPRLKQPGWFFFTAQAFHIGNGKTCPSQPQGRSDSSGKGKTSITTAVLLAKSCSPNSPGLKITSARIVSP